MSNSTLVREFKLYLAIHQGDNNEITRNNFVEYFSRIRCLTKLNGDIVDNEERYICFDKIRVYLLIEPRRNVND